MSERVLFQVVRLDELHPTLTADIRSDVFVFHHVVLKLTGILESLLALCTPAHTQQPTFAVSLLECLNNVGNAYIKIHFCARSSTNN